MSRSKTYLTLTAGLVSALALSACGPKEPPKKDPAAEARTGAIPDTIAAGTLQRPAGSRSVAQLDASAAEKAAASKPMIYSPSMKVQSERVIR